MSEHGELPGTQEHDPAGDKWERYVTDPDVFRRDRTVDRETARAIAAEEFGEWTPDGFRPSTWS